MDTIKTPRLHLVPAAAELIQMEIEDLKAFAKRLGVEPVHDWPSENLASVLPLFLEQLENDPSLVGWLTWYWVCDAPEGARLVGCGGFKGAPTDGVVEVGYETRVAYRRNGFAAEAVQAHVRWALQQPDVQLVVAETRADNKDSMSVLSKLGFRRAGSGSELGLLRFERDSTD